ncbi:MAG: hypothetical protein Q4P22_06945 [Eubacteriales bacterium]|nr:hypothetical protein [Eubacteriales bacterium]
MGNFPTSKMQRRQTGILERPEYQGHTVNFKTYKQSYKSKKTCYNPKEKQQEVCPTHFIRAVVLEQGVLAHMRLVIACVSTHEERFRAAMGAKQKTLTGLSARYGSISIWMS